MLNMRLIPIREGPLLTLRDGITLIGSGDGCDARIPHYTVSEKHCSVESASGTLIIRDLGSMTGTLVNGQSTKRMLVEPGDVIEIGGLPFRLELIEISKTALPEVAEQSQASSIDSLIAEMLDGPASPTETTTVSTSVAEVVPVVVPPPSPRILNDPRPMVTGTAVTRHQPQRESTSCQDRGSGRHHKTFLQGILVRYRSGLLKLTGCLLIVVLAMFPWSELGQTSNEKLYRFYATALEEITTLRTQQAGAEEWVELRTRLEPLNSQYVNELKSTSGADRPIRQQLLFAGRDHLPRALQSADASPSIHEESLRISLENARFLLDGRQYETSEFDLMIGGHEAPWDGVQGR